MILCCHGCNREGIYLRKSGKYTCSPSTNSCPEIRRKNSIGVAKAHENHLVPGWNKLRSDYGLKSHNKGKYTKNIKMILVTERGHKCEKCQNDFWNDLPIPLELEHIDGNNKNNDKDNLQLLCPNCHAQTPTWRRKKTLKQYSKFTENEMVEAVLKSHNMGNCLNHLGLSWGSGNTILKIMEKHKITFLDS